MSTDLRSFWQGCNLVIILARGTLSNWYLQFGNHWKGVKFDGYSDPDDNFMITLTRGPIWQSFELDDIWSLWQGGQHDDHSGKGNNLSMGSIWWTLGQGVQLDHFCKGDNLLSLCQWGQYAIILTRGTIWQSLWHGCNLITLERETTWQSFW